MKYFTNDIMDENTLIQVNQKEKKQEILDISDKYQIHSVIYPKIHLYKTHVYNIHHL